jgi:hypothetical protein
LSQLRLRAPGKTCPYRICPGWPAHVGGNDGGALATSHAAGEARPTRVSDVADSSGILIQGRFLPRLCSRCLRSRHLRDRRGKERNRHSGLPIAQPAQAEIDGPRGPGHSSGPRGRRAPLPLSWRFTRAARSPTKPATAGVLPLPCFGIASRAPRILMASARCRKSHARAGSSRRYRRLGHLLTLLEGRTKMAAEGRCDQCCGSN